jgi:transposase
MMRGDDVLMMPAARRIEVLAGPGQRRRWSAETKAQIVAESYETSVGEVADRYSLGKTQVFTWRRDARRSVFAEVVVEDPGPGPAEAADGAIEIELVGARVRIGQAADPRLAVAVIGALRAGR